MLVKNQAVTGFQFSLTNRIDGTPITSGTVTGYYLLDGGDQTPLSGTAVHEGNGQWSINLTATETNGDIVGLIFVHVDAYVESFTIETTPAELGAIGGFASEVAIANAALLLVGDETITAFTDDSTRARMVNQLYPSARDEVLEAYPWTFAITRVQLNQLAASPLFGFSYQYQLPSDCLRMLEPSEESATFRVEGRKVLTDESTLYIRYIKRVVDPSEFTPGFSRAVAAKLASYIAYPITRNHTLSVDMNKLYELRLADAASVDGQSGTPLTMESTALTEVR